MTSSGACRCYTLGSFCSFPIINSDTAHPGGEEGSPAVLSLVLRTFEAPSLCTYLIRALISISTESRTKEIFCQVRNVHSQYPSNVCLLLCRRQCTNSIVNYTSIHAGELHTYLFQEGTTFVIFSYNSNDPGSEDSIAQHQVAGKASVNLLSGTGSVEPAPLEADHKTVDVLNPSVSTQ